KLYAAAIREQKREATLLLDGALNWIWPTHEEIAHVWSSFWKSRARSFWLVPQQVVPARVVLVGPAGWSSRLSRAGTSSRHHDGGGDEGTRQRSRRRRHGLARRDRGPDAASSTRRRD